MAESDDDSFLIDDTEDTDEGLGINKTDAPLAKKLEARRSLEQYMEKRALRRQLQEAFGDNPTDLDDLGW